MSESLPPHADLVPVQLWTARPNGELDWANQQVLAYFDYTPERILSWNWVEVVHPDDLAVCGERWSASVESGEPYEVVFRLRRGRDGQYRRHVGRAVAVRGADGAIVRWLGVNTDIEGL